MALAFSPAMFTVVDSSLSSLSAFATCSCSSSSSSSSLSASHGFLQQRSRRLSGIGGGSSSSSSRPRSPSLLVVRASDLLGDFGARDPTTGTSLGTPILATENTSKPWQISGRTDHQMPYVLPRKVAKVHVFLTGSSSWGSLLAGSTVKKLRP